MNTYRNIAALLSGAVFAVGLSISGMTHPEKVIAFLDIFQSVGAWDPSLLFVIGGAMLTYAVAYRLSLRRSGPYLGERFMIPTRRDLTPRLIIGSAMFGAGWGLAGLCPAPAISATVSGNLPVLLFFVTMIAGMLLFRVYESLSANLPALRRGQSVPAA
jgi:uncharacterized membrane protein YedE/YeeE